MKLRKWLNSAHNVVLSVLTVLFLTGCGLSNNIDVAKDEDAAPPDELRIGETVRVVYSNLGLNPILPHEEQIKQDGTITLFLIGPVQAAGKTSGALQNELQKAYGKYYREMNVTVQVPDRSYSVGGAVKQPDRKPYVGPTTVIKAIQSAGDFTDFANRKKVQLTRANGKTYIVNCVKALKDPRLDLPVYAGDSIHVPQSPF